MLTIEPVFAGIAKHMSKEYKLSVEVPNAVALESMKLNLLAKQATAVKFFAFFHPTAQPSTQRGPTSRIGGGSKHNVYYQSRQLDSSKFT